VWALAVPARRRAEPAASVADLSEADRRLAALGGALAAARPAAARALLRDVDRHLATASSPPGETSRTRWARDMLLDTARVRGEFMRGEVVVADGWCLARSEAALCVYLHALDCARC
jgi:hypothetical protein